MVSLSPDSFCRPQDRPVNRETRCWGRNHDFTQKASRPGRRGTILLESELGLLPCSCSCSRGAGRGVPVNLHRDTCYSLFCSFLSLCEQESVSPLKSRALRRDCPCISGSRLHSFTEAAEPAQEPRAQGESQGPGLIWSQICSFVSQWVQNKIRFVSPARSCQ